MNLYVVYLGGKVAEGRVGEDHEVVPVVAGNVAEARKKAKAKWRGLGTAHVDCVVRLQVVDGHQIGLALVTGDDHIAVDPTWEA